MFHGISNKVFAILVYNHNAARDDNMEVFLNGTSIGTIDNSTNTLTGRIFPQKADPAFTPANVGPPLTGNDFQSSLTLDMGLLIDGTNTIRVESTNDANNGNLGTIQVGYYALGETTPDKYNAQGTLLLDSTYNHAEGPPNATERTFTYP